MGARRSARRRRLGHLGRIATLTSNGSVNSMHDSWTPLGSLVPFFDMLTRRGHSAVSASGLWACSSTSSSPCSSPGSMIGRTPEYLGKKLQAPETKLDRPVPPRHPGGAALLHGARRVRRLGAAHDHLEPRRPRLQRDPLRVRVGRRATTARRSPGIKANTVDQHHARHRDARRPLLPHHRGPGARRGAGAEEDGPDDPGTSPTDTPCSPACRRRGRDHRRPHVLPGRSPSARSSSTSSCEAQSSES